MIPIDKLLEPVSAVAPCGEDPSLSGALSELEVEVQGKPETQFSAAEEPNWVRLRAHALDVAATTKDLRVAAIVTAALLRTDGLAGFTAGLQLIRGYLERFWAEVYPRPDPGDGTDYFERLTALGNLAAPLGSDGDMLKIVRCVRRLPVLVAPRSGSYALEHYLSVREKTPWPEDAGPAPTKALFDAAKQELGPAALAAVIGSVRDVLAELAAIEQVFAAMAGPSMRPAFGALRQDLQHMDNWLSDGAKVVVPVANGQRTADGISPIVEATLVTTPVDPSTDAASWNGAVRNRDEVLRVLAAVVEYYQRCEPSSPVPFLVKRAARIVPMDFVSVMNELAPEANERLKLLIGEEPPPTTT